MRTMLAFLIQLIAFSSPAQQNNYLDSLTRFRNNYVETHEVVRKQDRQFLEFFPVDSNYRVLAAFSKINGSPWFEMKTSGKKMQTYRKYGTLSFSVAGKNCLLTVYQSQSLMENSEYKDYLFIPFTDQTSGIASYGGGRYLESFIREIHEGQLVLDFNKAYNPYCAYTTGYNCPIPPKENDLAVSIEAGEKNYAKSVHAK